jgi:quaternary ammonium compound-resistance protein SugE
MAFVYLMIAGFFEIVWAVGMKYAQGFSKLWPSIITILGMLISVYFLALAVKVIPLGNAYAIWTGVGIVGTAICGIVFFNESASLLKLLFIALICIGIVGLKIIMGNEHAA